MGIVAVPTYFSDFTDFNSTFLLSILIGFVWGILNFFLLTQFFKKILLNFTENFLSLIVVVLLKFPLLYFMGYKILATDFFAPFYSLIGFTLALITYSIFLISYFKKHLPASSSPKMENKNPSYLRSE